MSSEDTTLSEWLRGWFEALSEKLDKVAEKVTAHEQQLAAIERRPEVRRQWLGLAISAFGCFGCLGSLAACVSTLVSIASFIVLFSR